MKKILSILTANLIALSMVGCDNQEVIPAYETIPPNVTLNVMTSYGGDDGNRSNFEKAIESYEENTDVKINDLSQVSNDQWKEKVISDFMTGSEPDVLFYFTNADADPFINANKVVSIEDIRERYPDYATNMKESMMATAPDGKHYAVPGTGFWETLFVNKEVLSKCGVEIPGPDYTWEQFLCDCEKIKSKGFTPIACSLFEIPHYWFEFMVMNNGTVQNHLEVPKLDKNGKLVQDEVSSKWINGLNDIKYLYEKGYFPNNTLTAHDVETVAMFAKGKAAFLLDGSWKVGYLTEHYPDKIDNIEVSFVPGKNNRAASEVVGGISMGYFITRKAWDNPNKREAAVKFVFHMTSEEILGTFVTTESTALVSEISPVGFNALQQSAANANTKMTNMSTAVQDQISSEAKSTLFFYIQNMVKGEISPEEAIETALKLD